MTCLIYTILKHIVHGMNSSKSYDEDGDFPVYVYVHRLSVHKQEKALNFI